jgi:hypothetical protein
VALGFLIVEFFLAVFVAEKIEKILDFSKEAL